MSEPLLVVVFWIILSAIPILAIPPFGSRPLSVGCAYVVLAFASAACAVVGIFSPYMFPRVLGLTVITMMTLEALTRFRNVWLKKWKQRYGKELVWCCPAFESCVTSKASDDMTILIGSDHSTDVMFILAPSGKAFPSNSRAQNPPLYYCPWCGTQLGWWYNGRLTVERLPVAFDSKEYMAQFQDQRIRLR